MLYYGAWAAILLAWARASGDPGEHGALATLRQRIEELKATGAEARLPYYLSLLAGLEDRSGDRLAALRTLDEAIDISGSNGDTWWDAELHRLRGELLGRQGERQGEALAALERALSIAREQEAGMLEARARESLAMFRSNARA